MLQIIDFAWIVWKAFPYYTKTHIHTHIRMERRGQELK